ncbi:hypothetical protein EBL_c16730 [Shimwellia blattae DSM 4481 = NBRC 105725]|uniref:Uncharacterized protein n=1 Tax=Shimwellia blattae (strain ATCC 29907 / DSM 4481 / JCM 1650 / NBRC 105725 / CDC 9005-74) TaxID=630626 RepID=I2B8B3_SHIBC|nr:hypothetical protein EBL_c16730 [Shimwellia blattae DSM 4481 = NBRC 105725]
MGYSIEKMTRFAVWTMRIVIFPNNGLHIVILLKDKMAK